MATAAIPATIEPFGLVVRDGGETKPPPRIWMYFWADEEEANDDEEWREH